jgi:undecaprenyl phosphate N,N'-diacetylbacillosamine 1-phosphate transferase
LNRMLKRIVDLLISIPTLILFSPLLLLIACSIKLDSKGPVLFLQQRVGKDGYIFQIYKFRTMVVDAEKMGTGIHVEKNDSRITRLGKFLRHTSLDELPQLVNIIKGEMSIVGPRPTLAYQAERYDDRQKRRLLVKPGITGWAQVNGRNALTWPERIELDLWYIDNWSILLDVKVLLKTVGVIFSKKDIYKDSEIKDPISSIRNNDDQDH